MTKTRTCQIDEMHCEQCGSTSYEDLHDLNETDGYSRCCNQLVSYGKAGCRGFHYRTDQTAVLRREALKLRAAQAGSARRRRFGVDFLFGEDGLLVERADGKAMAVKHRRADGYDEAGWVVTFHADGWDQYTDPFPSRRDAVEFMATEPSIEQAVNTYRRPIHAPSTAA